MLAPAQVSAHGGPCGDIDPSPQKYPGSHRASQAFIRPVSLLHVPAAHGAQPATPGAPPEDPWNLPGGHGVLGLTLGTALGLAVGARLGLDVGA